MQREHEEQEKDEGRCHYYFLCCCHGNVALQHLAEVTSEVTMTRLLFFFKLTQPRAPSTGRCGMLQQQQQTSRF